MVLACWMVDWMPGSAGDCVVGYHWVAVWEALLEGDQCRGMAHWG